MRDELATATRLDSSPEARAHLEHRIDSQQKLVQKCLERDALQADRPEGCWCLGLGTRETNPSYIEMELDEGKGVNVYGPSFCVCLEAIAMKKQCAEDFRKERKERRWAASGIPLRFRDFRLGTSPLFKNGDGDHDLEGHPLYEALIGSTGSIFLWGDYGTGKTGLAIGMARVELEMGEVTRILFRSVPDLLSALRSTYGRAEGPTENDIIDQYATVPLLILDDMGAEQVKSTGWVEDRLYQIIGRRHGEELTTYFTSNLSPIALGAKIGERIVWRIIEMCGPEKVIEIKGPNLRDKHG